MFTVQRLTHIVFSVILFCAIVYSQPSQNPKTFCNPMNLNYRFMVDAIDAREAADPVMILFKGDYYLFASRSGGYWTSPNLRDWTLIVPTGIDLETYAPAVVVMRDSLFYVPSNNTQIYKTADPKSGVWVTGPTMKNYGDPDLFLDDDGKLFMYYGLSNNAPTSVVELDPMTFKEKGSPANIVTPDTTTRGWERRGDNNLTGDAPWIEGSWMLKQNNKYYLHYSAPGTEWKTYADGIYVADSPKGPFTYANYSPFSFKPTGFIAGAGHGSTFMDKDGNYWRVVTMTISIKHMFERRLGLFPVGFDNDGNIFCNTSFQDYPQYYPGEKENPELNNLTNMMLLSHKKYVTASSSLSNHNVNFATDEEIRTYWSAQTGNSDEWLMMDLGTECDVEAIQINFAEEGTTPELVRGRSNPIYQQYILEISNDGKAWSTLIDKSSSTLDMPHDYIELEQAVKTRYVKLKNVFTPGDGKFAIRDLRIFGNSAKRTITDITDFTVNRNASDKRTAVISWNPVANADGYIVHYGIAPDKLYNNYMVYDANSITMNSLTTNVEYYFSVQAFDGGTDYYKPTGEFKSFKSGNWNDVNSWQRFNGTEWIHPAPGVPAISDERIVISPGHAITVTVNDSADQALVDSGATLIINPGVNFKVIDGIGTDLVVQGTLDNKGVIEVSPSSTLSFVGGGVYNHNQDGGEIPTAEWREGSTCNLTSILSTAPSNGNQNFSNIIWDNPNQSGNLSLKWNGNKINGDITIGSTGSGRWQMCAPSEGSSVNVEINGNVLQTGGVFTTNGTSNGNTSISIFQKGNIGISGGNFSISRGSQGGTGKTEWFIDGNFSMNNATTQNSNPAGAKFIFTGSQFHSLALGNGNTLTALPIEVDSGATLNIGTSELLGSGIFTLKPAATLISAHTDGINGNLKNSGVKTLSERTSYGFIGVTTQVTGDLIPDEVRNLIVDNISGLTLSKSVTVKGTLEIKAEGFSVGAHKLTYGSQSTLQYSGTKAFNTSDNEFPAVSGPENLTITNSNAAGISLHASREISGNLILAGKLKLGDNNFAASSIIRIESNNSFVSISGNGYLKIPNVGLSEKFIPIGASLYSPVWISNSGTPDNITIRVESDADPLPDGGRVKAKWILNEETSGSGNYTLKFGWGTPLEDTKFRRDRQANAGIFLLSTDTTEAGTGNYTTQLNTSPFTISRGGITELGAFGVGKFGSITDVKGNKNIVTEFLLSQNYPNPFNPETKIDYSIPKNGYITLKVYNLLGQVVATLFEGYKQKGNYSATFNANGLSSGVYLYQLKAENFIDTKKTILLK